jgi:phenylacetate-coenzyme A ligase PaaK-like adenylate-forming protein
MTDHALTASGELRERAGKELAVLLPEHLGRLRWDAGRLAAHQRDRLRSLLAHAVASSPFHARRLAGIDIGRFELSDLSRLPVMTKAEMMAEFDEVVTDRRLTLARVQAHLEASRTRASLLLGEYACLASGGSSGTRATFVQSLGEYMDFMASFLRLGLARTGGGGAPSAGMVIAVVAAASPVHSSALAASLIASPVRLAAVPATLPLGEMTGRLNALQPPAIAGYPAMLAVLAAEQRAGRLRIAPMAVTTSSEQLADEDRASITDAFGVPVTNQFASTEGLVGTSEPGGQVLTFATDMCVAELVSGDHGDVPPGGVAEKVLVTNLHNFTQPLIRYELADRFGRQADDAAGRLRATVHGRADWAVFRYGEVVMHTRAFDTELVRDRAITEYQVRQTERGADIAVVVVGPADLVALRDAIRGALARSGLTRSEVTVRAVPSIGRHAQTGKVVRFQPLPWRPGP